MTEYPVILGGDHAAFEVEWATADRPAKERPDWPLPSFDSRAWAAAFCKIANGFGFKDAEGKPIDEGWMTTWFANALMRGYDQRTSETVRGKNSNEKNLLLTIARIMRARIRDEIYAEQAGDLETLNEALAPFDPLPEHGGDFEQPAPTEAAGQS